MAENLNSAGSSSMPSFLAGQLLRFPAYTDAKGVASSREDLFQLITAAYENDQLTEEQELIFESLLYLYNLTEDFDLRRALEIWDEQDFMQFQVALSDARGPKV